MVSAPYNFVPLSPHVCTAEDLGLAGEPSQDIPETGGRSGVIQFTLTCDTPLLIGNGDNTKSFVTTPDGTPVIPGSSLRGMTRAVLEIASFGQMALVEDQRVGVRDLGAVLDYRSKMTAGDRQTGYEPRARAGFLRIRDGCHYLRKCSFARIDHRDLDALAPGFRGEAYALAGNPDQNKRVACEVEELFASKGGKIDDVTLWIQDDPQKHEHSSPLRYRRAAATREAAARILSRNAQGGAAPVSQHTGRLVFTGLPSTRKHMEFFFYDPAAEEEPLDEEVWAAFISVHEEQEKVSETWKWRRDELNQEEEIPVFYLPPTPEFPKMRIGLAMMFTLAADNSIHDMIGHTSADHLAEDILDLPTRMFGKVAKEENGKTTGFRTRISFGWAELKGDFESLTFDNIAAARPKPSFTPSYVRQRDFADASGTRLLCWARMNRNGTEYRDGRGNPVYDSAQYRSYMNWGDQKEHIRGWKRYPVKPAITDLGQLPTGEGASVSTLKPIRGRNGAALTFTGCIRYHNLAPVELGALVWVLTWGGNDALRHSLGMGKPFGWGQVKIALGGVDAAALMQPFTEAMEQARPGWAATPQIRQLLAMANPGTGAANAAALRQMKLDPQGTNEFAEAKKNLGVLPEYPPDAETSQVAPGIKTTAKGYEPPRRGGRPAPPHRAQQPPPGPLRVGSEVWCAGEEATIVSVTGNNAVVRFSDGSDMDAPLNDLKAR